MFTQTSSKQELASALTMALDDEYRARATYQTILNAYGDVWPFNAIVHAEQRHIDALLPLFQCYGITTPPVDRWSGNVELPATLQEACQAGAAAEISNYQMYDSFLSRISEEDVRQVFWALRNASALRHLPAFQACVASNSPEIQAVYANTTRASVKVGRDWKAIAAGVAVGIGAIWLFSRANESQLTKD